MKADRIGIGARTVGEDVPSEAAVRAELEAILSTARFERSPRSSAILRFVVEEALAGRTYQINEGTIADNAFEADPDGRSRSEATVRVAVVRLRQALSNHYRDRRPHEVEIAIPTGSYVPLFTRYLGSPPSVAVIIPDDIGVDPAHGHVRFGVAEAIAARLATSTSFRVFGALNPALSAPEGERSSALDHMDYVLGGTVRSVDESIRIEMKLRRSDGRLIWSHECEGNPSGIDLVEFEHDVASSVAGAVGDYTGIINRDRAGSGRFSAEPAVHQAWSRYFAYMHLPDDDLLWEALEAMERAVAVQPDARARGVLAHLHTSAAIVAVDQAEEHLRTAAALARAAFAETPDEPHAALALGVVELLRGHHDLAREEFARIGTAPSANPSLLYGAGIGIIATGAWADGIELIERAIELNPGHYGFWMLYPAFERYRRGDHRGALAAARAVDLPSDPVGGILRAAVYVRLGQNEPAEQALRDEGIEDEVALAAAMTALRHRLLVPLEVADDLECDAKSALCA